MTLLLLTFWPNMQVSLLLVCLVKTLINGVSSDSSICDNQAGFTYPDTIDTLGRDL